MAPAASVANTQTCVLGLVLLCPSLLLSASDHRSFVERLWEQQSFEEKIEGTTKQTAVVIEFLDGVGGRKKEDRSIGGSLAPTACHLST